MEQEENKKITTLLRQDQHEWLRAYAFNNKMSMAMILRKAVDIFKESVEKSK